MNFAHCIGRRKRHCWDWQEDEGLYRCCHCRRTKGATSKVSTSPSELRQRLGLTESRLDPPKEGKNIMSQTTTKWTHTPGIHGLEHCAACRIAELEASHQTLVEALEAVMEVAFDGPSRPVSSTGNIAWKQGIEAQARAAIQKARGE